VSYPKKRIRRPNKESGQENARRQYLEASIALNCLATEARTGESKVYALDSFVRLLDTFCAELELLAQSPPHHAADAVKKVLQSRVRLPVTIANKPSELKRVTKLMRRYGVGSTSLRLPHKLKGRKNFDLQLFAASLVAQTRELRRHIEDYGPNIDDFQQRLSKLPLLPTNRWRPLVLKSAEYFHGKDWLETAELCVRWARPWRHNPRKPIPEHRSKQRRLSGDNSGVRKAKLREHAEHVLRECLVSLIGSFQT